MSAPFDRSDCERLKAAVARAVFTPLRSQGSSQGLRNAAATFTEFLNKEIEDALIAFDPRGWICAKPPEEAM